MIRILDPGLYTLVVDQGRLQTRSLGVSVGGPADRTSFLFGNALVGNSPSTAALEFSLAGPTIQTDCELGCVVTGAPFELHTDRKHLQVGTTFTLQPGETLYVGSTPQNIRGYLCVRGGFEVPSLLGSRSSIEPLTKGMELPCQPSNIPKRFVRYISQWNEPDLQELHGERFRLRILDGGQTDLFPDDWFRNSTGEEKLFRVNPSSNRMGVRLEGEPLQFRTGEMISEPVSPGTIQVTREGQCVILGVDGQTIGGYPKIAQVISADLDVVGQLRPGDSVSFERVPLEKAEELYRTQQEELAYWLTRIRLVSG